MTTRTAIAEVPQYWLPRPTVDGVDLLTIARRLARSSPSWPGSADRNERCWRTISTTDHVGGYVIGWPVGTSIDLHDHGSSAGAIIVVSGSLVETSVSRGPDALGVMSISIPAGGSIVFEPGHVHGIVNDGPQPAVSVHVYAPALSAMTFFDSFDGQDLVALRTQSYADGEVTR